MSTVVVLTTPEGEKRWKKLSARIPDFRAKYPAEKGWSMTLTHKSVLDANPAMLEIVKAAISANRKIADYGLQTSDLRSFVFTATLTDPSGKVIQEATARFVVTNHKDHEAGESASVNRLLAQLGFNGEILDADESHDLQTMDSTKQGAVSPRDNDAKVVAITATPDNPKEVTGTSDHAVTAAGTKEPSEQQPAQDESAQPKQVQGPQRQTVLLAVRRAKQLEKVGIKAEVPALFKTEAEVQAFLAELEELEQAAKKERTEQGQGTAE